MIKALIHIIAGDGANYRSMFLRNELRSLLGNKSKNLKTLFYFSLLAFFAVTFAQSGLKYLRLRMDNPYINWITFPVTGDISNRYVSLTESLSQYASEDRFTLDNVNGFMRYSMSFYKESGGQTDLLIGRTFAVPKDSILLSKTLSNENTVVLNAAGIDPSQWSYEQKRTGIIITSALAKEIGCQSSDKIYSRYSPKFYTEHEVLAIVSSLPDRSDFMTAYELYWGIVKSDDAANDLGSSLSIRPLYESKQITLLIKTPSNGAFEEADFDNLKEDMGQFSEQVAAFSSEEVTESCFFNQRVTIALDKEQYDLGVENEVLKALGYMHAWPERKYNYHSLPDLAESTKSSYSPGSSTNKFTSFSLHFSQIDSIRPFRQFLLEKHNINISLEQVEARENFHLVSILTSILAFALGLFTLVSIILFITSILKSHLEKIKMNLGTFMAFGLQKSFLVAGYTRLISGILLVVSLVVLIIVGVLDVLNVPYRVLTTLGMNLKPDFNDAFTVLSSWLFVLILLILIFTWRNCRRLVNNLLKHYPSDLINNRIE